MCLRNAEAASPTGEHVIYTKRQRIIFQAPNPDSTIVNGTPRTFNENVFQATWEACDSNQTEQQLLLALKWFRKAIREKYIIDQFISYWIALEISNFTFRDILYPFTT